MKLWRSIAAGLGVILVVVLLRAVYLQRIWTITRTWLALPETSTPPLVSFLLPSAWGSTVHNVYGDVVFLRVRGSSDLSAQIAARWPAASEESRKGDTASATHCGTTDLFRLNPVNVAPQDLAPCFEFGKKINPSSGSRRRTIPTARNIGGFAATEEDGTVYLVVYRVR